MRIFVSYASEDREMAQALAIALREQGVDVFFDRDALPAGEEFHQRIHRAIEKTDVFIPLLSEAYLSDGRYAMTELNVALEKWALPTQGILPVNIGLTDSSKVPSKLLQVTFVRPRGNTTADVVRAAIRKGRQVRRRKAALPLLLAFFSVAILCAVAWIAPRDLPGVGFTAVALLRLFSSTMLVGLMVAAPILLIPSAKAQLFMGLIPLVATLFTAGAIYLQLDPRPATDSQYLDTDEIKIAFWAKVTDITPPTYLETFDRGSAGKKGVRFLDPNQEPSDEGNLGKLVFTIPSKAKVNDETIVGLEIDAEGPVNSRSDVAALAVNDRISVAVRSQCRETGAHNVECDLVGQDPARASWVLRANSPGVNQLSMRFDVPERLVAAADNGYIVTASLNGVARVEDAKTGRELATWSAIEGRDRIDLSRDARFVRYRNRVEMDRADIDLRNGMMQFRFDVSDTLGVAQSTYDAATLAVVAFTASMAGAPLWIGLLGLLNFLGRRFFGVGKGKELAQAR